MVVLGPIVLMADVRVVVRFRSCPGITFSPTSFVSSNANTKSGTCCTDGLGLNYTLPMFNECKKKQHPNGSMVQTIPKLIPYSSALATCARRKSKLGIPPGHRICRFPDCDRDPCANGWCKETMENFKCHCSSGYRGKRCNIEKTTLPSMNNEAIAMDTADPPSTTPEQSSTSHATCGPTTGSTTGSMTSLTSSSQESTSGSATTTGMPEAPLTSDAVVTSESVSMTTVEQNTPTSQTDVPTTVPTTTYGATTVPTTEQTTPMVTTNQPTSIMTTRDASTMFLTDSTTLNPTTTTPSPTTQEATTFSTTSSTTPYPSITTPSPTTMVPTTDSTTSNPTTTAQPTAKIFVTSEGDDNKIFVADLQDELAFTSIPATKEPRYMTYDPLDNKIYWTDKGEKRVFRADVDGGNRETVTNQNGDELRGIAIAVASRTLYIASAESKITQISIGQSGTSETDFKTGLDDVYSLEVDEEQGYLYWSMNDKIVRKPLDGSGNHENVYHIHNELSEITGLSIDINRSPRRIYFCDYSQERTFSKDVDTPEGDVDELTSYLTGNSDAGTKLRDISYFNGVLYWSKEDNPSGIGVMTNYDQSNRAYAIKTTSNIVKPHQLLVINVDP